MSRLAVRFAAVVALAGLTVACAGPQHSATVAPPGYGSDDISRAQRLVQYCDRLVEKGELVTALGLCARAHEIDPDDPDTLMKVAGILRKLERTQAAAQTYGLVLEMHPGHHEARYSLGKLYMESGDQSLAAIHFNQAMRRNPEDPRPYNALGILRDQAGEHQAAQALYRSALERDPDNFSVRNNLGLSLALSGQRDEAIEVLAELAVDPEVDQTVLRNLEAAYAAGTLPPPDEALADETSPTAGQPPLAMPAGTEPVETRPLNTAPYGASPAPNRAPAAPAPAVEVKPRAPQPEGPTPLYPQKPNAARETQHRDSGMVVARPSAAGGSIAAKDKARDPVAAAAAAETQSSAILAAAEMLMQPPAWADFEPGDLVTEMPVQEPPAARFTAPESQVAEPEAAEAEAEAKPKAGTARFNSLSEGSYFSSI